MALAAQTQSAVLLAFPGQGMGAAQPAIAAALKAHRLPELLAAQLLRAAGPHADAAAALTSALAARFKNDPLDLQQARGILLLGASGVGKSMVANQIHTAAQALGRDVMLLPASKGLNQFRAGTLPATALVVMEAEGFHPLNPRARGAFGALSDIEGVESVGVVSALADAEDAAEMVAGFRFRRIIVTNLDRTRRLGALTAAVTGGARLAHVLRGPNSALESLAPGTLAKDLLAPAS